jgi:hypothetical protein
LETVPHALPTSLHVDGVHGPVPHTFGAAPPQVCADGHVPQSSVPPQPLAIVPQFFASAAQFVGWHGASSQLPEMQRCSFGQSVSVTHKAQ